MPAASLSVPVAPPLSYEGGQVASLDLREPTGDEMHAAEKEIANGVSAETITAYKVTLVAKVAGLAPEAVDMLRVSTHREAYDYLQAFDQVQPPAVDGEPDTLTIRLPQPLVVRAVTYTEITMREPTVGERRRAETRLRPDSNPATRRAYQMVLVAAASEPPVPFDVVGQMPVSVLNAAEAFVRGFIDGGRKTGSS